MIDDDGVSLKQASRSGPGWNEWMPTRLGACCQQGLRV